MTKFHTFTPAIKAVAACNVAIIGEFSTSSLYEAPCFYFINRITGLLRNNRRKIAAAASLRKNDRRNSDKRKPREEREEIEEKEENGSSVISPKLYTKA